AAGVHAVMPPLPGAAPVPPRARPRALRRPGVLAVLPLTALGMGAGYTVYAYTVPVLDGIGAGGRAVPWMLCLYGAGAVAGNFAAGLATDRWGAVRVLGTGYALMAAGLGVLALSAAAGVRLLPLTAAAVVAWGASSWCQTPPQQHRLISAAPRETALVVGLNASAIYTGIGLGTLLGGLLLPLGTAQAAGAGAVLALAAGAWLAGTRRYR
ncbi:MFS transporter, partial [Streptomyces synnematoformans]|uniref:MFS transporter n=1 Tax=Streptomyces synnematoformans TaxID=415721 RepID=UPI0031E34FAB